MLTYALYIQMCMLSGSFMSEIFDIPGLKLDHFSIDLMHTGDLGILLYLLGNIIWEMLMEMGATNDSHESQLSDFMDMLRVAS